MLLSVLFRCAFIACMLTAVRGYSHGPPIDTRPELCNSMMPTGHRMQPQSSPAPFKIEVYPGNCKKTGEIQVSLLSNASTYFEGFLVLARSGDGGMTSYGVFSTLGDKQLQTYNCTPGYNNALAHSEANKYTVKNFTWTPSSGFKNDVYFIATVVHELREFWTDVRSNNIRFDDACALAAQTCASLPVVFIVTLLLAMTSL